MSMTWTCHDKMSSLLGITLLNMGNPPQVHVKTWLLKIVLCLRLCHSSERAMYLLVRHVHLIFGGGGGGWDLCVGRKFFFGQYRSKVIFFAGPSGRIISFTNESYKYRGFRDNFMLNSGFRDNYMLNSGFNNKLRVLSQIQTQFRFSRQLHTARGPTRQLHSQLNALFRFSSQLHTQIDLISLCEHHSHIIKSCLVMIIGHSNCEKGYKVLLIYIRQCP